VKGCIFDDTETPYAALKRIKSEDVFVPYTVCAGGIDRGRRIMVCGASVLSCSLCARSCSRYMCLCPSLFCKHILVPCLVLCCQYNDGLFVHVHVCTHSHFSGHRRRLRLKVQQHRAPTIRRTATLPLQRSRTKRTLCTPLSSRHSRAVTMRAAYMSFKSGITT
jgi:hypothetical protein